MPILVENKKSTIINIDPSSNIEVICKETSISDQLAGKDGDVYMQASLLVSQNVECPEANVNVYADLESRYGSKRMIEAIKEKSSGKSGVFRMRRVVDDASDSSQAAEDLAVLQELFGEVEHVYVKVAGNSENDIYHGIYAVKFANQVMAHVEYSKVADQSAGFEMEWSSRDVVLDLTEPPLMLNRGGSAGLEANLIIASAKPANDKYIENVKSLLRKIENARKGGQAQ